MTHGGTKFNNENNAMTKPFKTFSEQVERITNKGIIVEDKILLEKFLAQIIIIDS